MGKKNQNKNLSERLSCWSGYERVPGTKAGEPGSCRKKGSKKRKR